MNQLVAIGAGFVLCTAAIGGPLAAPGGTAPNLEGVQWIRGEPVERFETGRVYVLEFWSTWCAACIEPIEHLNELARRYKADATLIGIHIWQRESAPTPTKFLEERVKAGKPVMEFPIVEDVDDALAKIWMDATENGGLPTAMIVDRASRLVWFGHSKDLEEPLKAVVEGKYDISLGITAMKLRIQVSRKANDSGKAIEKGEYDRGMALMLEAFQADPDTVAEWMPSTYGHLLHASQSPEIAATFVRKVLATREGKNAKLMTGLAQMILNFRQSEPGEPNLADLNLALELAEKAIQMSNSKSTYTLSTLARIRTERSDLAGAIEAIELAIKNATDENDRAGFARTLESFRKRTRD